MAAFHIPYPICHILVRARLRATVAWGFLLLASAVGCRQNEAARNATSGAAPELEKVTLFLNWFPEAEHGGFYAALVEGYYKEAGLEVTILPGGPNSPVAQQVACGAATFGVTNADNLLFARAQEAPIVALMAPLQTSPRCLIVHERSGIKSFDDLHDLTLAVTPGAAFAGYMQKKLPLTNVRIVPYQGNVAQFLTDKNFAQQGYVFSEPYIARQQGGDPKVLMISELGFNPYASLLITSEDVLTERREMVRKMVSASVRGWVRYIAAPEAANRVIHERNPAMDADILAYGAKTLAPLVLDGLKSDAEVGKMTRQRWQQLADQLVESEQIKPGAVDPDRAFTLEFLVPEH